MSTKAIFFVLTLILCSLVYGDRYEVPAAHIEALHPKGFRVCIPDEDGIQLFAFHGSINKELPDLQAGDYSADVLRRKNGHWCFIDSIKKLKFGDVINYWTYVQRDRLGYRRDGQNYTVTSFVNANTPIGLFMTTSTATVPTLFPSIPTLAPIPTINSNEGDCALLINGLNENINQLHVEISNLAEINTQILKTLHVQEMKSSGRALVVTGLESIQSDLKTIISGIVTFTLNIPASRYTVKTSERLDDGGIMFELKTEAEKDLILSTWLSNKDKYPRMKIEEVQAVGKRDPPKSTRDSDENPEFVLDVRRGKSK